MLPRQIAAMYEEQDAIRTQNKREHKNMGDLEKMIRINLFLNSVEEVSVF